MARIVVAGYMIRYPMAGMLFAYLHYVLGLHRLGHTVAYLEESGWSGACYDPTTRDHGEDPSGGIVAVRALMSRWGVAAPVLYVDRDTGRVAGGDRRELERILTDADLLINLGGVCWLPEFGRCRRRALVDMDPVFTQLGRFGGKALEAHQAYFSYGANIGQPGCPVPTGGIAWQPTVPPVVLEIWRDAASAAPTSGVFTTVANWSAYGGIEHDGTHYGQKNEEFLRLIDLPRRTREPLEVALSNVPAKDRTRFVRAGWRTCDGHSVSSEVDPYLAYVAGSRGEFSVAKNAYVRTRCGWFSDRSVCYLAAGRPVVLQDTGLGDWLEIGEGVLAYTTLDEAAACLDRVGRDYARHRRAARQIAAARFAYKTVLPRLLEVALDAPAASA